MPPSDGEIAGGVFIHHARCCKRPSASYPNGDQLVMVDELSSLNSRADVSPANWLDWQRESRTFRRFAAWQPWAFTLTGAGEPRRVNAQLVSSEFFPLLGVAPLLGRTISDEDDRPNAPGVAVLSYRAWQDHLGGDRRAIGRTVQHGPGQG